MEPDEHYWQEEARKQKARADLMQKRKANWIFATLFLGIFVFADISPYIDNAVGLSTNQIGWVLSAGFGIMIVLAILIGFSVKRK